jgi:hypothetical protein
MVLVFAESPRGQFKKSAFEAVTYGKKVADALGTSCAALVLGTVQNAGEIGRYGASRVLHVSDAAFDQFDSQAVAAAIAEVAKNNGATVVVLGPYLHRQIRGGPIGRAFGRWIGVWREQFAKQQWISTSREKIRFFGQSHRRIRNQQRR